MHIFILTKYIYVYTIIDNFVVKIHDKKSNNDLFYLRYTRNHSLHAGHITLFDRRNNTLLFTQLLANSLRHENRNIIGINYPYLHSLSFNTLIKVQ